mmetsp:Transcript_102953/g.182881  ORF Transcript_102953/g.182881 Transcript_102953/m.182881 type:complete len:292 (-) Transcript_102953:1028-1903(-)
MEGCKVKVHISIPHVVFQAHGHQRHHSAKQQHAAYLLLHIPIHLIRNWIFDISREWPVGMRCLKRFLAQQPELHELKCCEAGLRKIGWCVLEHVTEHSGTTILVGNEFKLFKDNEVDQGREAVQVRCVAWESILSDAFHERAVHRELIGMPVQAKLEVHLFNSLSFHLRMDCKFVNVPAESFPHIRLDQPGVRWKIRLCAQSLPDVAGLPKALAQDLLVLEALVQVSRNEPQGDFPVFLQVYQKASELFCVHQRLRLVGPLAFGKSLWKLVGDDAVQHEIVQAGRQLLAHN